MNCTAQISALEPLTGIVIAPIGCQKHAGHAGMHYYDQVLDLLDGRVRGRLMVGWERRDVWVRAEELAVIDGEGRKLEPQLIFKEGMPPPRQIPRPRAARAAAARLVPQAGENEARVG